MLVNLRVSCPSSLMQCPGLAGLLPLFVAPIASFSNASVLPDVDRLACFQPPPSQPPSSCYEHASCMQYGTYAVISPLPSMPASSHILLHASPHPIYGTSSCHNPDSSVPRIFCPHNIASGQTSAVWYVSSSGCRPCPNLRSQP